LLSRTSARAAAFQSLTTVAHAEVAHTNAATKVVTLIIKRNSMVFSNLDPDDGEALGDGERPTERDGNPWTLAITGFATLRPRDRQINDVFTR